MHIYSPRIEMYAQMAADRGIKCSTTVEIDGELVCSIEKLKSVLKIINVSISNLSINVHVKIFFFLLKNNSSIIPCETYHIDHHHPSSKNNNNTAILYSELGTSEFSDFHRVLKQYAEKGSIDYVLRHFVKVINEQF